MKILILWASLADYSIACYKKLSEKPGVELHLVYQPVGKLAPYEGFDLSFFKNVIEDSNTNKKELIKTCVKIKPQVIYMASWNYSHYMTIARMCKAKGTYVLSTFDGQWVNSFKQRIGITISAFFLKPAIDNFFIPGDRQAQFAYRLGYKNPWYGFLCANTNRYFEIKQFKSIPNNFLFIGRLVQLKGIKILLAAYQKYRGLINDPWGLIIAGTGPLEGECAAQHGVVLRGFTQPDQVPHLFEASGCLILPSIYEPWGLVLHEAAIAGLPIISTYKAGASTFFVRDGQNGYIIEPEVEALVQAMIKISSLTPQELELKSAMSKRLGQLWTVDRWADYLYNNLSQVISVTK